MLVAPRNVCGKTTQTALGSQLFFGLSSLSKKNAPYLRVGFPWREDHPTAVGRPSQTLWEAYPSSGCLPFLKKTLPIKGWASLGGKTTQPLLGRPPNRCGKTIQTALGSQPFFGLSSLSKKIAPYQRVGFPWREDHPTAVGRPSQTLWEANQTALGSQPFFGLSSLSKKIAPFQRVGFPWREDHPTAVGQPPKPLWEANPSSGCLPFKNKALSIFS